MASVVQLKSPEIKGSKELGQFWGLSSKYFPNHQDHQMKRLHAAEVFFLGGGSHGHYPAALVHLFSLFLSLIFMWWSVEYWKPNLMQFVVVSCCFCCCASAHLVVAWALLLAEKVVCHEVIMVAVFSGDDNPPWFTFPGWLGTCWNHQ